MSFLIPDDPVQSQLSPIRTNGVLHDEGTANSSRDFDTSLLGSAPSYPSVVFSTPLAVPMKHIEENPIKVCASLILLSSDLNQMTNFNEIPCSKIHNPNLLGFSFFSGDSIQRPSS